MCWKKPKSTKRKPTQTQRFKPRSRSTHLKTLEIWMKTVLFTRFVRSVEKCVTAWSFYLNTNVRTGSKSRTHRQNIFIYIFLLLDKKKRKNNLFQTRCFLHLQHTNIIVFWSPETDKEAERIRAGWTNVWAEICHRKDGDGTRAARTPLTS